MKKIVYLLIALYAISPAFGLDTHRSIHLNLNPSNKDNSHLKLNHQYSYSNESGDVVIFGGHYKPFLDKTHHIETGFGYRKFVNDFGIGANLFYTANNNPGFFAHRFSPGLELFLGAFQLSINQYYPLKKGITSGKSAYDFPVISEFGITFKPSIKYEFGITPSYDHSLRKWGISGHANAFISNSIELGIRPFFMPKGNGISFSIGYVFGGPKSRRTQEIRKSGEFLYSGSKIVKKNPISIAPINLVIPQDLKDEIVESVIEIETIATPPPTPTVTSWRDFFFRGPSPSSEG